MNDYSGSITTGGTAQAQIPANGRRRFLRIENPPSATESLFVRYDGTASVNGGTPDSTELSPGMADEFWATGGNGYCPGGAVSMVAATTGHKFIAKEE